MEVSNEGALALRAKRGELIIALRNGKASGIPRENRFQDEPSKFDERIGTWIDLLIGYLEGLPAYGPFLISQTLFEVHRPELDAAANRAAVLVYLESSWTEIAGVMCVDDAALSKVKKEFDDLFLGMRTEPRFHAKTLLIGDCLMSEVGGLAANMLACKAISFDVFPLNGRNTVDLDYQLSGICSQGLDAIFFSPFSHARLAEIDALLDPARMVSRSELNDVMASIISQTDELLRYLARHFECPIYVHNSAVVARASTPFKTFVLNGLTRFRRAKARTQINQWLKHFVAGESAAGRRQFHIIDEAAIASSLGVRAGTFLYTSDFQHSTGLSLALAEEYARIIGVFATLRGKKLVICDLDHTLWQGIIGEGTVSHFFDRQEVLRRLKEKSGIVLTIASKNDPEKVNFSGALLTRDDFVAPQISWGHKVDAIANLRRLLNLQFRHMVFIDDRPDERAFVAEAYPDLLVLDATDRETWRRLELWADLTESATSLDRTQLYQQQVERDDYVATSKLGHANQELIAKLELEIDVRVVRKADLRRFVELINRTNQWNMTGARTSLSLVRVQSVSPDHLLLLASARDKFGNMGDVCAATITFTEGEARIDSFVLSCRVFGYAVETAMLDAIKQQAAIRGMSLLRGRYVATTQNQIATEMYSSHGFKVANDGWFVADLPCHC